MDQCVPTSGSGQTKCRVIVTEKHINVHLPSQRQGLWLTTLLLILSNQKFHYQIFLRRRMKKKIDRNLRKLDFEFRNFIYNLYDYYTIYVKKKHQRFGV